MAALNAQTLAAAGTVPTFAEASAGGDTAPVGSGRDTVLVVLNGSGGSVNVTLAVPGNNFWGTANPDNVVAVAAGATKYIPLRKEYDDGTGRAAISTSAQTDVDLAVVRVG